MNNNYYLCNYSVEGVPCCFIGDGFKNIARILKYCIEKHGWSLDDRIDVIHEDDAYSPGATLMYHEVTNDEFTRAS